MRPDGDRRLLWAMQVGQRPWRELYWLSLLPRTRVTAVGAPQPPEDIDYVPSRYRQPTTRFIEAGAMAWLRDLDAVDGSFDWVAGLEPFSLVTGQMARRSKRTGERLAVLMWHNFAGTPLYRLPGYRQAWTASRDADLFLCMIQAAADHAIEMGIEPERVRRVYPGIDVSRFHPPATPTEEPILVFVSPLRASKGVDRVLEAFTLVRHQMPEARLVIAGTGEAESMVRRAVAADPTHVSYVGGLTAQQIPEVLGQAAVFVTAPRPTRTWNEQFGLAYLEAMACGLPVVTTVCGTNHEAVPPPNLRTPDDAEALADALVGFLSDPVLRRDVGTFNRDYVVRNHEVATQARLMGEAFTAVETQ